MSWVFCSSLSSSVASSAREAEEAAEGVAQEAAKGVRICRVQSKRRNGQTVASDQIWVEVRRRRKTCDTSARWKRVGSELGQERREKEGTVKEGTVLRNLERGILESETQVKIPLKRTSAVVFRNFVVNFVED